MRKSKGRGLSYQTIINRLNEKDIPTKNGKSWSKSTVWGILRNPIYDNLPFTRSKEVYVEKQKSESIRG